MAKICIVTHELHSSVLAFARSLEAQKHEISIITSHDSLQLEVPSTNFPVMTYFKKWSVSEAMMFVPHLFKMNPDHIHFFFPMKKDLPRWADFTLASIAKSFNKSLPQKMSIKVFASFFETPSRPQFFRIKSFLSVCDGVSFGTQEYFLRAKRSRALRKNLLTAVIPPLKETRRGIQISASQSEDLLKLLNLTKPYIVLPSSESLAHFDYSKINPHQNVIVFCRRPKGDSRSNWTYLANLNAEQKELVLSQAMAIVLALDEFSLHELNYFKQISQENKVSLVVNFSQLDEVPGLCVEGRSGFLIDPRIESLAQLLISKPGLKASWDLEEAYFQLSTDSSLNELNRLYSRTVY